jgi:tetratricopeptide (TPR) repeat protein
MQEFWFNFDLAAAKAGLEQARELNPADAAGLLQESVFWSFAREFDRAIEVGQRALELDPLDPTASRSLAWIFYDAGRYEEALEQHQVTRGILERFPDDGEAYSTEEQTTWNLTYLGRTEESWRVAEQHGIAFGLLDSSLIRLVEGDSLFVEQALPRLLASPDVWDRDNGTMLQAQLGDLDPGFAQFDSYYRDRNPRLWWIMNERIWPSSFLEDPRWAEWRRRLGLPT